MLRVLFVSQLVGHVACLSLLPFALCQLGESGLGKSTLVNSLFLTDLYKDRKLLNAEGKLGTKGGGGVPPLLQGFNSHVAVQRENQPDSGDCQAHSGH